MPNQVGTSQVIRFTTFEVDLQTQELRKGGLRLKLSGQPFQVLAILLEQPGVVVTREELQKRLWPDTLVDVDHNLNTAINKIREALGDSSENPRFVETLPRRGYRFIAPIAVDGTAAAEAHTPESRSTSEPESTTRTRVVLALALFSVAVLLVAGAFWIYKRSEAPAPPPQRTLTRITFDDGLQLGPTWSPDRSTVAYSSDQGGKLDIWIQKISGGDPIRITSGPGNNWQPDWSPDGKYIAYRSEENGGGLHIIPALRTGALDRRIASFGYRPRWSPDSSQILFQNMQFSHFPRFYVVSLDGGSPREIPTQAISEKDMFPVS